MDGGLNERLDRLVRVLDSTNKTLEKVSADMIDTNERQSRQQNKFQIIYLVLTAFIVITASSSAYFSYKSIKISSGQKSLQTVQVILDIVTAVKEQNEIDQKLGANKETSKKGDKSENKK